MPSLFRQLLLVLNKRQRRQVVVLLGLLIVRAAVELIGVASIAPFMAVVADPGIIHRQPVLRWLYEAGGYTTDIAFMTTVGIAMVVLLTFSNAVSALGTWLLYRFAWSANHQLSIQVLEQYLAQPYAFFVRRNSSSMHKTVLTEVTSVIQGVLLPVLIAVSQALVLLAIVATLVVVDPILALSIVTVLGGAYVGVYLVVRRRQERLGRIRLDANHMRFRIAAEAFGGIKDVKVLQEERSFLRRFAPHSRQLSTVMASNAMIAYIPRYMLETVAFGGVLLIVLYYLHLGRGLSHILPVVSLYALAGYRLMPALQTFFAQTANIRFNRASLNDLANDMMQFERLELPERPTEALPFERAIELRNIRFRYENAPQPALRGASLRIEKNRTIGLVGASGSGKTTLVDLLLGLYEPSGGRIVVDDVALDPENIDRWRLRVGYVPQQIFLSDDSIARNIAFGLPRSAVDMRRVEEVARIAHLHDFITTLPQGYETTVGERGVRLSGGQRQRIGIARALYRDPDVLVMDEATSALDGVTEDALMEAIRELAGRKTIVLIAHRLSTVKDCDRIYLMENGGVTTQGTYDELVAESAFFRAMARIEPMEGALS